MRLGWAERSPGLPDKETEREGKAYTTADAKTKDVKRVLKTMLNEGQDGEVTLFRRAFYAPGKLSGEASFGN